MSALRRSGRGCGLALLLTMLAGVLVISTPAPQAAGDTTTTTTVPGAGNQAGGVVDVVPRTVDLVFRTSKDAATVSEQPGNTTVDLAADVLFAFDSDRLTAKARSDLEETARLVRQRAKGPVRVEGHTDSVGSPSYNQDLSERRARAVRDALARLLADRPTQFSVQGFGATRPIAANKNPDGSDNPKGRAKNRRVAVAFSS
jgi:outer membrane protein OmpA-like peptidoglycan-associated protein